jgi:branched-chain amino acid transport system substrate-binding protein
LTRHATYLFLLILLIPFKGLAQNQGLIPPDRLSPDGKISIGLMLPDHSYMDVVEAAEQAIRDANLRGGYKQKEFELVVRTAEGFWGAGSKESVGLVYEDHVRAIIGYLDGRNGHLAEQVATKSHLTYIETLATEPTLSQAYIPWFMRLVPNDNQQSARILKQILQEGGKKIGILSADTYDTRYAVKSLTKAVTRECDAPPVILELDTTGIQQENVLEQIRNSQLDHLVIPFDACYLKDLIVSLRKLRPDMKIYGTLHFTMGVEMRESGWKHYEGVYMIRPFVDREKYSSLPDTRSAYLYDAVMLVVNAIHKVGTERETITHYISDSTYPSGVTGSFSFDELGNRLSRPGLIQIKKGIPVSINSPK